MKLSVRQKELICALTFTHSAADTLKRQLAEELGYLYLYGSKEVNRNERKAHYYFTLAGVNSPAPKKVLIETQTLYSSLNLFTSLRLLLLRINRLAKLIWHSFLPKSFRFASLSSGLELIIDSGELIYDTFSTPNEKESELSYSELILQRFKNLIWEGDRPSRVVNALVWFVVNLICLFVTSGLSAVLNTLAFAFDFFHELLKTYNGLSLINSTISEMECEKLFYTQYKDNPYDEIRLAFNTKLEIAKYDEIILQLHKLHTKKMLVHNYKSFAAGLIVVGTILFFFPPLQSAAVVFVGAAIVLAAGSVFGGVGHWVYEKLHRKQVKLSEDALPNSFIASENLIKTNSHQYISNILSTLKTSTQTHTNEFSRFDKQVSPSKKHTHSNFYNFFLHKFYNFSIFFPHHTNDLIIAETPGLNSKFKKD